MLLLALLAHAKPEADTAGLPFSVVPYGFVVPSFTYIADDPSALAAQDGFQIAARLGIAAEYAYGKDKGALLGTKAELELTPEPQLKDAFAYWRPTPIVRLEVGQKKVPFAAGYMVSDTRRLLPAVPQIYTDTTGRDIGATVMLGVPIAKARRASLTGGMFNGEGANRLQNVNQKYKFVVRGLVTPFGARSEAFEGSDGKLYLGVGGGWLYNWLGADESSEEINQYGADLQFAWNVVSVQGEFILGQHAFANAAVADYNQMGWYATVSSYVPVGWARDHVELVGRVGQADPDDASVGSWSGQVAPFAREITGGVNVYWVGAPRPFHDVKVQLAYSTFAELEGDNFINDRVTAAATVRF